MTRFLLAATALLVLAACSGRASTSNATVAPATRLTPTPQAASLGAAASQAFSVVLEGHGTAGYEWSLQEGYDTRIVRPRGAKRTGELAEGAAIGASSAEIFDFTAVAPGQATLIFVSRRPWEAPSPADETRRYTVTVR